MVNEFYSSPRIPFTSEDPGLRFYDSHLRTLNVKFIYRRRISIVRKGSFVSSFVKRKYFLIYTNSEKYRRIR